MSASPQSSAGQAVYRSGRIGYSPWMAPSSSTRYPLGTASSLPHSGA